LDRAAFRAAEQVIGSSACQLVVQIRFIDFAADRFAFISAHNFFASD
jgi:hypothetical protein